MLLAISVITAHFGYIWGSGLVGGPMAVEIFFMISGFYMLMVWEEKYQYLGARVFWKKRWLKIFPFYWLVLLLSLVSALAFGSLGKFRTNWLTKAWSGITNVAILGQDVGMFQAVDEEGKLYWTGNFNQEERPFYKLLLAPQAWSLALEIMFYAMVPMLARLKNRWLAVMIMLGLAGKFWLYQMGLNRDPWSARIYFLELPFFLAGMIAYRIYKFKIKSSKLKVQNWMGIMGEIGWIAIAILFQYLPTSGRKQWLFYGYSWLVLPWIFGLNKENKWDRYLGELAYGVYIGHWLVGNTLEGLGVRAPNLGMWTMVISLIVGVAGNKFNGWVNSLMEKNKREVK